MEKKTLDEIAEGFMEICDDHIEIEGRHSDDAYAYVTFGAKPKIIEYLKELGMS